MNTRNGTSIIRLSAFVLGALFLGAPGRAALASEPATASEAQAAAQHARDLAAQYKQLGGVGYKTGLVQRAEADAMRFGALAEQLRAPVVTTERSPEAARFAQLADQYRKLGGVGYKAGLVQWAEAQQRKAETSPLAEPPALDATCLATKPVVRMLACAD